MKKNSLVFLLLGIFVSAFAQQNKQVTKAQLEQFKKSTTYVVMDNNPMLGYNITIKAAIEKYWKITPYAILPYEAFDSVRTDPSKSFILLTKVNLTKDKREAEYCYLNVLMGADVKEINDMPELLSLPLDYTGAGENSYTYKVGVMVRFAQEHIKSMIAADRITPFRSLKYYNMNVKDIKKKTLLVEQADLSEEVNTLEKIKPLYPYEIKMVSADEIEKAVFDQTPNTLILHQIEPGDDDNIGRSYKIIYGVDDNKIYYFNFENITQKRPAGMLPKDFKRIAEY